MRHQELIRVILLYLLKNPEAGDTLDGIMQWWLLNEKALWKPDDIQRALKILVSKELLIENKLGHSGTIYLVNNGRLEEIRKLLDGKR